MKEIRWTKTGRTVSAEGTTVVYRGEGTPLTIESRKRHIPHANGDGTWDHTAYVILKDGEDLITRYSLADAKEHAARLMEGQAEIRVIYKRIGADPVEVTVPNTLKQLQDMVGGFIETVTIGEDWCVLCDEDGRLKHRGWNCEVCGIDFVGAVVFIGVNGDEFTDLPVGMEVFRSLFPDLWEE